MTAALFNRSSIFVADDPFKRTPFLPLLEHLRRLQGHDDTTSAPRAEFRFAAPVPSPRNIEDS